MQWCDNDIDSYRRCQLSVEYRGCYHEHLCESRYDYYIYCHCD